MNGPKTLLALLLLALASPLAAAEREARLHWVRTVTLSTPVTGVVAEVTVAEGDRVRQGQVLLRLDDRALKARVVGLEAQMLGREHDRDEARRERERTQEMYDRTLLAEHDLDVAKIQLATAEAALKTTQAALIQARWDLEYSVIRAPFDAWVIRRSVEPGQTVVSNMQAQELLELAEAGAMLARARVEARDLEGLRRGDAVGVQLADKRFPGEVAGLGLAADAEGLYPLDVRFETGDRLLRPGLKARLILP